MCSLENATTSPLSITQHHLSPWLPQKQTSCSSEVVKNNQRGVHSDFWVCRIFLELLMLPFCSIFSPPSLWPVDLHVNSHLWLLKSVWIKSWGRNIAVTWAVLTFVWQNKLVFTYVNNLRTPLTTNRNWSAWLGSVWVFFNGAPTAGGGGGGAQCPVDKRSDLWLPRQVLEPEDVNMVSGPVLLSCFSTQTVLLQASFTLPEL